MNRKVKSFKQMVFQHRSTMILPLVYYPVENALFSQPTNPLFGCVKSLLL